MSTAYQAVVLEKEPLYNLTCKQRNKNRLFVVESIFSEVIDAS